MTIMPESTGALVLLGCFEVEIVQKVQHVIAPDGK
jgi:hypothetical protein